MHEFGRNDKPSFAHGVKIRAAPLTPTLASANLGPD
jgi:hypothetical protein